MRVEMVSSFTVWWFKRKRNESPETTSGQVSAVHRTSAQKLEQAQGLQLGFLTVKPSLSAPVRSTPPPSPPTPVLSLRPLLTTSIVCCAHSLLYTPSPASHRPSLRQ